MNGRAVSLINIGTLKPYDKKASKYRDPESGKMQKVPRRKHIKFALSPDLKAKLRDAE